MYQLVFLTIARQDMTDIIRYISNGLLNPKAADKLADDMIDAAGRLADSPCINAIHRSIRPLKLKYRKLIVGNYTMFYWVDETEKLVTIARVIYTQRDYVKFLNNLTFWNVRIISLQVMVHGFRPIMEIPSNRILPEVAL